MSTPSTPNGRDTTRDAELAKKILDGGVYDQVTRDAKTGEWTGRRSDDHTLVERVNPS